MGANKNKLYLCVDNEDLHKVDWDFGLLFWYSKLKDYAKRFNRDDNGYVRIPPHIYEEDLGMNKKKFQRYNKKLEDKGLIKTDKAHRGGRTWAGYKLI